MKLNSNKVFAIYLLWTFLHSILFLISGNFLISYNPDFYPFPLYKTSTREAYQYTIYNELEKYYNMPAYEEYINKLKFDKQAINKLWATLNNNTPYFVDSVTFYLRISEDLDAYDKERFYTKYNYFPTKLKYYDYSEYIIYLFFPVVIIYFKKLWFSK